MILLSVYPVFVDCVPSTFFGLRKSEFERRAILPGFRGFVFGCQTRPVQAERC
jgi:hypothetical protein